MMGTFKHSQGHPEVLTLSVRHDRYPRRTRVSSKTTRVLSSLPLLLFLSCHRLIFEQLGKSVMWNNSLSTVTAPDLFPKASWAHREIQRRPTQQLESSTLTLPKGLPGAERNYIQQPNHEIRITVNTAHLEANHRKTQQRRCFVGVISSHGVWLILTLSWR